MKKNVIQIGFFLLTTLISFDLLSQTKSVEARHFSVAPKIDGILNDLCWQKCDSVSDFYQYQPVYNSIPTQKTVVRIGYDSEAVYISAMMYDSAPDSILREFGNRDDGDLNADHFGIKFDTYNMATDAYTFVVWASGVQLDYRNNDYTYSGVWQSAVKVLSNGWSCELKINYSAIRFPKLSEQVWGIQIYRGIRRFREIDKWALEVKSDANPLIKWGKLKGINNIKTPLRLSITPFISGQLSHFPHNNSNRSNLSYSFSGGLDLKYGINESFTLDLTLLPDFSQVQSDYETKNISAFETVYNDYRPFFNEAIDLFKLGDLFYSRRIGRTPDKYYDVELSLGEGEEIIKNPGTSKMLNAIKLSGRNKNGTAIGIFNAITNNMYATIRDSLGNTRKILTEPLTNYNIFVLDQTLLKNSNIYFVNTSVIRTRQWDDANVSLLGVNLKDKKNRFGFSASGGLSQKYNVLNMENLVYENSLGYKYNISFGKISGNFQFQVFRNQMNNTWDANDMGLVLQNNKTTTGISLNYHWFEPFWKFRDMHTELTIYHTENFMAKRTEEFQIELSDFFTTKKYLTIWGKFIISPLRTNNFVETRTPGRYFTLDPWYYAGTGLSSDYRKTISLDLNFDYWQEIYGDGQFYSVTIKPIIRPTKKFTFDFSSKYEDSNNDIGFAEKDDLGNIIMGKRDIITVENQFSSRYIFKNNLSLSLQIRHYWSKGSYHQFYKLDNDGELIYDPLFPTTNIHDFNFNAFNIDLMFYWEFAPGSSLNITYKNIISKDDQNIVPSYFTNLSQVFYEKQLNSLSIKLLYYLDYQQVKKWGQKHNKTKGNS